MSNTKITIAFKNIHQLWTFARKINAVNLDINTAEKVLTCECNKEDLGLIRDYDGMVIQEYVSRLQQNVRTDS